MRFELFIAWRHLVRRRKTGFISLISLISMLGVAVGVMALIVVLAVMSGFDHELKSKIVGVQPHLLVEGYGGIENAEEMIGKIESLRIPGLISVTRFVQGQAILRSETNAIGAVIKGVDSERKDLGSLRPFIKEGEFGFSSPQGALPPVLIGSELARLLDARVGDRLFVISPQLEEGKTLLSAGAEAFPFRLRGIFSVGMNDFDTSLVLVSLTEAQKVYRLGTRVSGLSLRLEDVDQADSRKPLVEQALGPAYLVRSWLDLNRNFFSALKVEKTVMTILLALIILVAAFNIVSTLIMVVMEKTRDIGVLRALGASSKSIQWIFILEGFVVGVMGVAVGTAIGLLMAFNLNPIADFLKQTAGIEVFPSDIYYFSRIPAEVNAQDVTLIVSFAFLMSLLAGVYPASRAAHLNPVEAIKYE